METVYNLYDNEEKNSTPEGILMQAACKYIGVDFNDGWNELQLINALQECIYDLHSKALLYNKQRELSNFKKIFGLIFKEHSEKLFDLVDNQIKKNYL